MRDREKKKIEKLARTVEPMLNRAKETGFPSTEAPFGVGGRHAAALVIKDAVLGLPAFREVVTNQLRQYRYPYGQGRLDTRPTFEKKIQKAQAMDALLSDDVLLPIRFFVLDAERVLADENVANGRVSRQGPMTFHRKLLRICEDFDSDIRKAAEKNDVAVNDRWLRDLRDAIARHAEKEMRAIAPAQFDDMTLPLQLANVPKEVFHVPPRARAQLGVFSVLKAKLPIPPERLLVQLTSLICSLRRAVQGKTLDPSPDAVRGNLKRYLPSALSKAGDKRAA
jgi:hypothetical protein